MADKHLTGNDFSSSRFNVRELYTIAFGNFYMFVTRRQCSTQPLTVYQRSNFPHQANHPEYLPVTLQVLI